MGVQQSRSESAAAWSKDSEAPWNASGSPEMNRRALIPRIGLRALRLIMDFAEVHAALMACRMLSCADKKAIEEGLKFMSLDHVLLRVPGELLLEEKERFLLRTHLGEEIEFFHHPTLLQIAQELSSYYERWGIIGRVQLNTTYLQFELLSLHETTKGAEVLEPLYKKLNFYEKNLKVDITELTILDPKGVMRCHAVGTDLAKGLAKLQHLRRVNCQTLTSPWFLEQMKNECSQLVSGGGFIDR